MDTVAFAISLYQLLITAYNNSTENFWKWRNSASVNDMFSSSHLAVTDSYWQYSQLPVSRCNQSWVTLHFVTTQPIELTQMILLCPVNCHAQYFVQFKPTAKIRCTSVTCEDFIKKKKEVHGIWIGTVFHMSDNLRYTLTVIQLLKQIVRTAFVVADSWL
jgi:hypothetical protein